MILRAEFTTEPFEGEGEPPAHAVAARDCLRAAGLEPEFGPLGTSISGEREALLPALVAVLDTVLDTGANRITLQVTVGDTDEDQV
ncbi:thiamine-binding protein [Saccharopolyspora hattusasensis]|uniref:thiamine-binding protein n=1 Tax=Saccharopolyspora hattusasensis TaxID=1128679 RepID=UPI003D9969BA